MKKHSLLALLGLLFCFAAIPLAAQTPAGSTSSTSDTSTQKKPKSDVQKATDATVDTTKKAATKTKEGAVKATDATVDTTKKRNQEGRS